MARLHTLERALTRAFTPPKERKQADPDYGAFRAECAARGLTYKVSRDGYLDLSDGKCFPHYNWGESLERLRTGVFSE